MADLNVGQLVRRVSTDNVVPLFKDVGTISSLDPSRPYSVWVEWSEHPYEGSVDCSEIEAV